MSIEKTLGAIGVIDVQGPSCHGCPAIDNAAESIKARLEGRGVHKWGKRSAVIITCHNERTDRNKNVYVDFTVSAHGGGVNTEFESTCNLCKRKTQALKAY